MLLTRQICAAAAIALVCAPAVADSMVCKVVGVSDGDTITALCQGHEKLKVRLAEIDAPEKAQPFGTKSKQSLSDLCFGKVAQIAEQGRDRYRRTIARVRCAGIDANAEQVRQGFAWVYDRYVTDSALYRLQDTAQTERRGLWAESNPTPPWKWRKARR